MGQRAQEGSIKSIHQRLGAILQNGRHAKDAGENGCVVSPTATNGNLETMETDKNQSGQPYKAGYKYKAYEWANTRKGYWHIANSFILSRTVTDQRLRLAGYVFLSDYYKAVRVEY